jgi:hypothetical protein
VPYLHDCGGDGLLRHCFIQHGGHVLVKQPVTSPLELTAELLLLLLLLWPTTALATLLVCCWAIADKDVPEGL